MIKEVDSLEVTSRGRQGFGSTGINSTNDQQATQQEMNQSTTESVQAMSKSSAIQANQDQRRFSQVLVNETS